ncbi:MAG: hypothetical protein H7Y60_01330 [Rhodospirillaceae bacterium]|nr:hypothetical protein [Rhodospirillales bacterium]
MTAFRIHSLEHGRIVLAAARAAGKAVVLVSPQASQMGVGWWRELVRLLSQDFADVSFEAMLDCGPAAGLALAGIRARVGPVRLNVDALTLAKIASIAEQAGTRAESGGASLGGKDALDLLGVPDPASRCREALGS